MKNTLAENMLRFGVKNLKESDIKRIEEVSLNESFIDKWGVQWPHFADQAAVDKFNALTIERNETSSDTAMYNTLFAIRGAGAGKEAQNRMGTGSPLQFATVFWHAQAMNPNSRAFILPRDMSLASRIIGAGYNALADYNAKWGKGMFVNEVHRALAYADNIEWWDTQIEYPAGTKITRWQLFSKYYLTAVFNQLKPLFVAGTPTPATKQMQPGVKTSPGKQ